MGVVFEAIQEHLKRRVALKILPPSINLPEKSIRRFLREAESVAKLQHENIVQIYGIGKKDSLYYYAMQFIDGRSLDIILAEEHPLGYNRISNIMKQAAEAVDYAHSNSIIHRDIKPSNIIVADDDRVIITDFGLARQERGATLTESGALVGTPMYMSPEQIMAKKGGVNKNTDIYSLGATLYELLVGKGPFKGDSTQEILNNILEQEARAPRKIDGRIPWELDVIAMKAIEKEPFRRFASAAEMAADLGRFIDGEPIKARPSGTITRIIKKVKKHRVISLLTATVAILILVFSIFFMSTSSSQQKREDYQNRVDNYENHLREGQAFLGSENPTAGEQAVACLKKAVAVFPGNMESRLLLAQAYEKVGRLDLARTEYETILEFEPDNTDARRSLSIVQMKNPEKGTAEKIEGLKNLKRAMETDPESFDTLFSTADILFKYYLNTKTLPLAHTEREELLSTVEQYANLALGKGENADLRCLLGLVYIEWALLIEESMPKKRFRKLAIEQLNLAIKLNPNHRMAFQARSEITEGSSGGLISTGLDVVKFFSDSDVGLGDMILDQGKQFAEPVYEYLKDNFLQETPETTSPGNPPTLPGATEEPGSPGTSQPIGITPRKRGGDFRKR